MQPRSKLQAIVELGVGEQKYPIPMSCDGNAVVGDLRSISLVHVSGDDNCLWVADSKSAEFLLEKGHKIVTDPKVLKNRQAFLDNPEFRQKYPFWYG